ncbi:MULTISPECIES: copper resistance CopC family protein [unclassified Ruegeria]|uniref:copper resistance CopC family protein n=1 Tax=unclassified Ruegeria TaxID=2625375 RepID=UPI0014894411|nr:MULTISPECIES: copper resistance CopC family protein [unclassified Ruegeria]
MKTILAFVILVLLSGFAMAHSKVETTTPTDGATIPNQPGEVELRFDQEIRLTRVGLAFEQEKAVKLELGDQTNFEQNFSIPLPSKGSGTYVIEWRGLGVDGHTMQGEFSFTVE